MPVKLGLPIAPEFLRTFQSWASELRQIPFLSLLDFSWKDWEPVVSAVSPMSVTKREILYAEYLKLLSFVWVRVCVVITTAGTANDSVSLTLPVIPEYLGKEALAAWINDGSFVGAVGRVSESLSGLEVRKVDGSDFAIDSDIVITCSGIYKASFFDKTR